MNVFICKLILRSAAAAIKVYNVYAQLALSLSQPLSISACCMKAASRVFYVKTNNFG